MNQGTATAQRALEVTLVRQQIDAQAEAIRYIHQAYVAAYQKGIAPSGTAAEWVKMASKAQYGADSASDFGAVTNGACPTTVPGQKPFILNARTATVWNSAPTMNAPEGASLPPFSQIVYNSDSSINAAYGIWIEAVPSTTTSGTGFVDFHIRACWAAAGSAAPGTLGTIVRLYEPR